MAGRGKLWKSDQVRTLYNQEEPLQGNNKINNKFHDNSYDDKIINKLRCPLERERKQRPPFWSQFRKLVTSGTC